MFDVATRNRAGLMGPNHVATMDRLRAAVLTEPTNIPSIDPTLDLDFRNTNGAPFVGNFTRATIGGHRQNNKGILVPTVVNEPVIDFSAGAGLGTGFYGAYTNLLLRSEEFDNAAWGVANASVTANAIVAPDGTTTADRLVSTITGGSNTALIGQITAATAGLDYTLSVYLKAGTSPTTTVNFYRSSPFAQVAATITWGTTPTASILNTDGILIASKLEILDNGWVRVSLTINSGTATQLINRVYVRGQGTDNVSGEYSHLWGAQTTQTSSPVPYVPTTSATVARNADNMLVSGSDFTEFFNPVEGSAYVEGYTPQVSVNYPTYYYISDNSVNNRIICFYDAAAQLLYATVTVGGVDQASISFSIARGSFFRAAFSAKLNTFIFALNGMVSNTDVSGTMPAGVSRLNVGTDQAGGNTTNEHIRRLIYWPKALTAIELQRMTA